MTDFCELFAELLAAYERELDETHSFDPAESELVRRARAYLAQPEPSQPTRKELLETYRAGYFDGKSREGPEAHESGLRAVLTRYGYPTRETH